MSLTMDEIKERVLTRYDIDDLLTLLDVTAEQIVDRFEDKFINRLALFEEELGSLEWDDCNLRPLQTMMVCTSQYRVTTVLEARRAYDETHLWAW